MVVFSSLLQPIDCRGQTVINLLPSFRLSRLDGARDPGWSSPTHTHGYSIFRYVNTYYRKSLQDRISINNLPPITFIFSFHQS